MESPFSLARPSLMAAFAERSGKVAPQARLSGLPRVVALMSMFNCGSAWIHSYRSGRATLWRSLCWADDP